MWKQETQKNRQPSQDSVTRGLDTHKLSVSVAQSKGKRTQGFIDEPPLVTGDGKTLRGAVHCFFGHPFTMVIDRRVSGFERQTSCYPKGGRKALQ